jgi:hypothetical protein
VPVVLSLAMWTTSRLAARRCGRWAPLRRSILLQVCIATLVPLALIAGCGLGAKHAQRRDVAEKVQGGAAIALQRQQNRGTHVQVLNVTPSSGVSPMLFPIIFVAVFGFAASALFVRKLCQEVDEPIDPFAPGERPAVHRLMLVLLLVVGFIYAVPITGFVLTAAAMLLVLLWSFRASWKTNLAFSVALPAAIYHVFASYLNTPLPQGWLGW